nr:unnamed protein product [Digitaria exilis]
MPIRRCLVGSAIEYYGGRCPPGIGGGRRTRTAIATSCDAVAGAGRDAVAGARPGALGAGPSIVQPWLYTWC